jgi:hypothetical protein
MGAILGVFYVVLSVLEGLRVCARALALKPIVVVKKMTII